MKEIETLTDNHKLLKTKKLFLYPNPPPPQNNKNPQNLHANLKHNHISKDGDKTPGVHYNHISLFTGLYHFSGLA